MGRVKYHLFLLIVMIAGAGSALGHTGDDQPGHHSVEQVTVRLLSHDPDTGTYTFWCGVPEGAVSPRTWSVREDSTNKDLYDPLVQTDTDTFTTDRLTNEDLYHIGCQTNIVVDGKWENIRGDFHIDLRPEGQRTIEVHSSEGLHIDLTCLPQEQASTAVSWLFLDADTHEETRFEGTQRLQHTVPEAGLWDVECWMNDMHAVLPIEFFTSGPAYVPAADGCVPNEPCGNVTAPVCSPAAEACNGEDDDCDGAVDEGDVCENSQTCYNSVKDIPASCTGSISSDMWNGCRALECTSGTGSIRVLACDKAGHFEMYKQAQSGTTPQLCLGETCLQDGGFARSDSFPICHSGNQPPLPPTWIEPAAGKADVDPFDFHIHAHDIVDPEGDEHEATDFEIWDGNQRVWHSTFNTQILYHIHNADGIFEGALAGMNRLDYNSDYRLRARFHTADGQAGAWSEWRDFRTKPQVVGGSTAWTVRDGYRLDLVAQDVSVPVNIAMAPALYSHLPEEQRPLLYTTNLYGQISVVFRDGTHRHYATDLLNYQTFGSLPGSGENGVIGLYADPVSGDLYASLTYEQNGEMFGKVERFMTNSSGDGFTAREVILSGIPTSPAHQPQQITRGPDGKLYMSTGDADNPAASQDADALTGKILRFNDDGSMPADNPWPGTYTWAMGFRNAFGTDWRPGTNELWISHNGPDHNDGIYRVTAGFVGGWKTSGDTRTGTTYLWPQTTAPTALVFNRGNSGFPADTSGDFYVALSGATYSQGPSDVAKRILQFGFNNDGSVSTPLELVRYTGTGYSAPIGLAFGSDGLYFTDMYGEAGFVGFGETKGAIYRLSPGSGGNAGEGGSDGFSAGLAPARWYPQGNNTVWECKGIGGSGDYKYDYVFGDGQKQLGVTSASVYHTYPGDGIYTASCTVHDAGTGESASASTTLTIGSAGSCTPNAETCNGNDDDCDGEVDEGSACAPAGACYSSAQDMPVSCIGGTVLSDTWDGCRQVTCASGSNSLSVLACDKEGHFELYRKSSSGTPPQICLGETCLQDGGFARSGSFPICTGSDETDGTDESDENAPGSTENSAELQVAPWYPKGSDYVFLCAVSGFTPTAYEWEFGDGDVQSTASEDVYHRYASAGSYSVQCTARSQDKAAGDTLQVDVQ